MLSFITLILILFASPCCFHSQWGKHIPASYRLINKFPSDNPDSPEHVLPIVIVRQPFDWLRSMCKEGYDAKFLRRVRSCPLVYRHGTSNVTNKVIVKAHQTAYKYTDTYASLADMWTEWHQFYLNASFPRLLIRYEDLVLYPKQLVQAIADCTGKAAKPKFQYYTQEARHFVKQSKSAKQSQQSLLNALRKLGERDDMYWSMEEPSRSYAMKALDPQLLELFRYQHLDDEHIPATRPPVMKSARTFFRKRLTMAQTTEGDSLRRFTSRTLSSLLGWIRPQPAPSSVPTSSSVHRLPVSPTSKKVLEERYKAMLAHRKAKMERERMRRQQH
jgi:hypothetical protein